MAPTSLPNVEAITKFLLALVIVFLFHFYFCYATEKMIAKQPHFQEYTSGNPNADKQHDQLTNWEVWFESVTF